MDDTMGSIRWKLQQPSSPEEVPLSRLYHEGSKFTQARQEEIALRYERLQAERLTDDMLEAYKSYPGLPQVPLPRARLVPQQELQEVVAGRRSVRTFDPGRPVTLPELANLLQLTYGITQRVEVGGGHVQCLRAIPSAGALYPLELYLMAQRVEGLLPGLYHYRVAHHALEALEQADQAAHLGHAEAQWGFPTGAAFYLVVSAVLERTLAKYLERGYRFVLMEAGMVGYSATLLAECQGIRSCMMGGWLDGELERRLGLDGYNESVVHVVCFGRPPLPEGA
jgi:SagB-type dehydrogenase family enzyme